MSKIAVIIIASISVMVPVLAQQSAQEEPSVRFAPLQLYVDSGSRSLAAYQFELKATAGQIKIVGVEGGQHPAFAMPPYYDPAALSRDHVILAAYNTGDELPTGKTRVARVHVMVSGATPRYAVKLTVAAGPDGNEIDATATAVGGAER